MNNIWQGQNIRLRAVENLDLENYFCNCDFPADSHAQACGDRAIFPLSKTMMADRVASLAKSNPYGDEFFLIITDLKGNPIGNINTHSSNRINGTFQYGVSIQEQYRGKGYASEAILLVLRYYFQVLGFNKVETEVYDFNTSSKKLHEKLGFALEGCRRNSHFAYGQFNDVYLYGMMRSEFETIHSTYAIIKQ